MRLKIETNEITHANEVVVERVSLLLSCITCLGVSKRYFARPESSSCEFRRSSNNVIDGPVTVMRRVVFDYGSGFWWKCWCTRTVGGGDIRCHLDPNNENIVGGTVHIDCLRR